MKDCNTCRKFKKHAWCVKCEYEPKDLVDVVRCKDCRYWDNYNDVMVCMLSGGIKCIGDYCSYGERADT